MNYLMLTQAEGLKFGIEHYRRNKSIILNGSFN